MASTHFQMVCLTFDRAQGMSVRERRARSQEEKKQTLFVKELQVCFHAAKVCTVHYSSNASQIGLALDKTVLMGAILWHSMSEEH